VPDSGGEFCHGRPRLAATWPHRAGVSPDYCWFGAGGPPARPPARPAERAPAGPARGPIPCLT